MAPGFPFKTGNLIYVSILGSEVPFNCQTPGIVAAISLHMVLYPEDMMDFCMLDFTTPIGY